MNENEIKELESLALKVRENIIKMAGNGGCYLGASFSSADIILFLYKKFLNINISNLKSEERDYLFLSKGHSVPALYSVFTEIGILEKERLNNHLKVNDDIYWHPNRNIPGVEFHSGSLGHMLSVAMGVAYDSKLKNLNNKIVVILGDGELNEGSIWEASLVAAAHKLDNLIAIVDRNHFQANIRTEELIPIEPIGKKFEAFGWKYARCNGHDFNNMEKIFSKLPFEKNHPSIIIADTIRGKGLPSIEQRADRWFCNFTNEEIKNLINELYSKQKTELNSEELKIR